MKRKSVAFLCALGVLTTLSAGCAQGPIAPSPVSPEPVRLQPQAGIGFWVQAIQQAGHEPIAGARVMVNEEVRGVTGADGRILIRIPEQEVAVQVQADGYEPSVVYRDKPGIGETWTFYLWR